MVPFFFSSRRRHTRFDCDWSSDVCSSDLLEGEFADFVQKKRAAVCQFKPSLPSLVRAGERPAFVAEEFAFDEALRQRRAVHAHKGLVPSCAPLVNRACQQLLAGTSLPGDQDRGIRRGYSLRQPHDCLKRLALSYHDAKAVCGP